MNNTFDVDLDAFLRLPDAIIIPGRKKEHHVLNISFGSFRSYLLGRKELRNTTVCFLVYSPAVSQNIDSIYTFTGVTYQNPKDTYNQAIAYRNAFKRAVDLFCLTAVPDDMVDRIKKILWSYFVTKVLQNVLDEPF